MRYSAEYAAHHQQTLNLHQCLVLNAVTKIRMPVCNTE